MDTTSTSLRHPHIGLLDTIAIKLLLLIDPSAAIYPGDMERAREIVNDLVDYTRQALGPL